MNKKNICFSFIVCTMFLILSCATTGPGGKKSFIVIPESQEIAIGQGMAEEVSQTEKRLNDEVWQTYLSDIGQKIVSVSDRQNIEYHFTVIESEQINAFAAPGGYVYFYTGLLKKMDNEAELAAVMAHEISHVVGRHSVKRLQAAMGVQLAYALVFGEDGASEALNSAIGIGMGLTFATYSRENEREADAFGISYLVKAGYNPQGAVTMYEKLAELGGNSDTDIFEQLASTHPDTQERINNAKLAIQKMYPLPQSLTFNTKKYEEMKARLK